MTSKEDNQYSETPSSETFDGNAVQYRSVAKFSPALDVENRKDATPNDKGSK